MSAAPIHLAGEKLLLDPGGALIWPAQGLLAVADLHLEKGTACAGRGQLVPPWDSRLTVDRVLHLVRRWRPAIVVALGDSFHDARGPARLPAGEGARLRLLSGSLRLIWVSGNHDPTGPDTLGGECVARFALAGLVFRHEAVPAAEPGEISGHFHPKAKVPTRAGVVTRPCFVADSKRVMLPALGAYAGGLDVASPAVARLFPQGARVFVLGSERLFSFPLSKAKQEARTGAKQGPAPPHPQAVV